MRNILLLGLLVMLVGCAGKGYQAPAQGSTGSGIQVGDSDIAPHPSQAEKDLISDEEVVPADNTTAAPGPGSGTVLPDDSDLLVSNETNEDLISQEDVVGPP